MNIPPATVRQMNADLVGVDMSLERSEQLTVELDQLKAAIESVAAKVVFDVDPHDFLVATLEMAEKPA
jgi:hypothetical protein